MTRDEAIKYVIGHWPENANFPLSEWNLGGQRSRRALSQAFIWEDTLEGRDFWLKLSEIIDGERESEPEMVLPSVDWSVIKPEYKWFTQDEDGSLNCWENHPEPIESEGVDGFWLDGCGCNYQANFLSSAKPGAGDWTKLIVKRPESLWYPDDSGEWVEFSSPGECPVDDNTYVEVIKSWERNDRFYRRMLRPARGWVWVRSCDDDERIVAYKVVKDD